ncbi:glycosyltransferase [Loigolactobacillus coryniformis]|uniref:glycosyltransferase n=1 Tax=Loigolactobacillus coryniformis TaxID=1610 RepID=UPI00201A6340|nr:glycosyltransferase [Loigolactobacillus coryniformis]MCL5457525.1 glycosyltransferase [Loigolactobacillus coryniformis]
MSARIAAGIVSFNPNIMRLKENINSTLRQVNQIFIFDNGSANLDEIIDVVSHYKDMEIKLIQSHENIGLARALNKIMESAQSDDYEWLLTLDQDSILQQNTIKIFQKYTRFSDVAVICPFVLDSRRKYMVYEYDNDIEEVDMCITSGSLTRLSVWKNLGGFDDDLFIDLIDNDYCKRVKLHNYRIVRMNKVLMSQEFGKIESKNKFSEFFFVKLGKLLRNTNIQKLSYKKTVNPMRVYYTNRNILYLNKKFSNYGGIGYKDNYHCNTYLGFQLTFSLASIVRGKDKIKILNAVISGIVAGKKLAKNTVPVK